MNKLKIFTHNDLDGVGCAVIGILAYEKPGWEIDVEYLGYNNVNERLKTYIENKEIDKYHFTYITDISPNEEVAKIIDNRISNYALATGDIELKLIDHHKTAEWLNVEYPTWANVEVETAGVKQSGTSLFYRHLTQRINMIESTPKLDRFNELVRLYDTWDWKESIIGQEAKDLNDIFHLIGIDDFVNKYLLIVKYAQENNFEPYENHVEMLKYKRKEIEQYISKKMQQVKIITDEFGNKVGFVVADSNISELGNKIAIEKECDYSAIYTGFNISLRSVGDFDVSQIAKHYGGGGHKNASGMPPQKYYIEKYLES